MKMKRCPACNADLSDQSKKCPQCGLDRLDQLFFTKENRNSWIENVVNPLKQKMSIQAFAGNEHVLFLKGDGSLYGFGNGDSGQFGEEEVFWKEPHLITTNVLYAAAGCNYSIFSTRSGELVILGTGEYGDVVFHFGGNNSNNSSAREVYALKDRDVFWIHDSDNRIWGFGDNYDENIELRTSKELASFGNCSITVTYKSGERIINSSGSNSRDYIPTDDKSEQKRDLKNRLIKTDVYSEAMDKYTSYNLDIDLGKHSVSLIEGTSFSSENRKEKWGFNPTLYYYNYKIFNPVLCNLNYWEKHRESSRLKLALTYFQHDEKNIDVQVFQNPSSRNWEAIVLTLSGELKRYEELKKGQYKFKGMIMDQVMNFSIGNRFTAICLREGKVLIYASDDFKKGNISNYYYEGKLI